MILREHISPPLDRSLEGKFFLVISDDGTERPFGLYDLRSAILFMLSMGSQTSLYLTYGNRDGTGILENILFFTWRSED